MTQLLDHLVALRDAGRKLLVPYIMGGIPDAQSYPGAVEAISAEADAIEIGLPYSDPLMDGPVIAAAAERAIAQGIGPLEAMDMCPPSDSGVARIAMTYYNPIHHLGERAFCGRLLAAGFHGLIVPDLPLEESESLRRLAAGAGLAWVPLVAPTSPPPRVRVITATATGFVYAVSSLGVTGTRETLSERAAVVVEACRKETDLPVLVGIGVSTPAHAAQAAAAADGVVIGTAVVRRILEEGADVARAFLAEVRASLSASP